MNFFLPARFFVPFSTLLVIASIIVFIYPGPKLSIDFTGGTLLEIRSANSTKEQVQAAIDTITLPNTLGNVTINATQEDSYLLRMRSLENEEYQTVQQNLKNALPNYEELQLTTIGSTVGSTMKTRAFWALVTAIFAIIIYIAIAFRGIPKKYSPLRFGVIAAVTLFHDIMITVGVFVLLSHYTSFQMDTLFITALLTILGYSVNDTIIIFDRIRDNLGGQDRKESFQHVANRSLNESLRRSVNTSLSTIIMLLALYFFGSESIRWFVLTLVVGMIIGTYSSVFLATPLLTYWQDRSK
jgi:preprotein translocase subunit SecF